MDINPPTESYRYLHTSLQLKLGWKDKCKLLLGQSVLMGACFRIAFEHDENKELRDVSVDFYSTRAIVAEAGEPISTADAVFNYDELHKTNNNKGGTP